MGLPDIDGQTALLLAQDGLTSGAIYALLALSIVLVFTVTRVIFVAQGELVAFGALTLAALQQGKVPGTIWLLLLLGGAAFLTEAYGAVRRREWRALIPPLLPNIALPVALLLITRWQAPLSPPLAVQIALTLALVVPIGPMVYRIAFWPIVSAGLLTKLFVAVAVHYVLLGFGLTFFGAEGWRTSPFTTASIEIGTVTISGQSLWVLGVTTALMLVLWLGFGNSIWGKALRATAFNRTGARLVGIRPEFAGIVAFGLAALLGAFSGILIAPITTIYYDSGFLIVLKGIVGSVIGAMSSYPLTALGAVFIGLLESYASYFASKYKEIIVFTTLIPVLLWRSVATFRIWEEEDE